MPTAPFPFLGILSERSNFKCHTRVSSCICTFSRSTNRRWFNWYLFVGPLQIGTHSHSRFDQKWVFSVSRTSLCLNWGLVLFGWRMRVEIRWNWNRTLILRIDDPSITNGAVHSLCYDTWLAGGSWTNAWVMIWSCSWIHLSYHSYSSWNPASRMPSSITLWSSMSKSDRLMHWPSIC